MPYQTILHHAIHKSHDQLQVSGLWKVCYFDLSIEILLFYYKEDAFFEDSKKQKRIFSFSLTECLLCSPCWRLANMNRQVYPFIPSSYPMWLLGLSPNEALCKTSKDKKEGEWTHLHRAYEGFNIWLIVFLYLWHIFKTLLQPWVQILLWTFIVCACVCISTAKQNKILKLENRHLSYLLLIIVMQDL